MWVFDNTSLGLRVLIFHTCLAFFEFGNWRNEYQWECYISSSINHFVLNLNAEAIWNAKQEGNLFQMILQTDIFETWMLKMNFIHFHIYVVFLSDLRKLLINIGSWAKEINKNWYWGMGINVWSTTVLLRDTFLVLEFLFLIDYLGSGFMISNVKASFGNIRHYGSRLSPSFNLPFPLTLILKM